mgnify:CR=1 FL=1
MDANRSADATARLCVDALGVCSAGATIEPWTSEQEPRMRRPAVVPDEGLRTSQSHDPSAFPLPDVSDGRVVPVTSQHLSSVVCPGGQGDLSIVGDLLLMSVEETRGRVDCGQSSELKRRSTAGVEAP